MAASGGVIVAFLADRLSRKREIKTRENEKSHSRQERKRAFRSQIKSIRAELMAIDLNDRKGQLINHYRTTIATLRRACCDISEDINNPEFESTWIRYCGLSDADIYNAKGSKNPELLEGNDWLKAIAPQYEEGRELIVNLLDRLVELAK